MYPSYRMQGYNASLPKFMQNLNKVPHMKNKTTTNATQTNKKFGQVFTNISENHCKFKPQLRSSQKPVLLFLKYEENFTTFIN